MPQIEVSHETHAHIKAIALLSETTPERVVEHLVRQAKEAMTGRIPADPVSPLSPVPGPEPGPDSENTVAVYFTYFGHRVEGILVPETKKLTLTSPPWNGETFDSPSGAASAAILHFNPERAVTRDGREQRPATNGWREWRLIANGDPIQTVRPAQSREESPG